MPCDLEQYFESNRPTSVAVVGKTHTNTTDSNPPNIDK